MLIIKNPNFLLDAVVYPLLVEGDDPRSHPNSPSFVVSSGTTSFQGSVQEQVDIDGDFAQMLRTLAEGADIALGLAQEPETKERKEYRDAARGLISIVSDGQ